MVGTLFIMGGTPI